MSSATNLPPWLPTLPHLAGGSGIVLEPPEQLKIRVNLPHSHRNLKRAAFSSALCISVTTEQF